MDRLAAELRAIREDTGKSLKQLQRTIHVSDSSLSRYLSGRTVPPWNVVEGLCRDAGRREAAIHTLYVLWEQAHRERNGAEAAIEPAAQAIPVDGDKNDAGRGPETAWWRRHTRTRFAAPVIGVAALFGSLGVWAGESLKHPATIVITKTVTAQQQDSVCANWAWPTGQGGQAVGPAAQVHGADHTPVVELLTGTVDGRQMTWARIRAAVYGDRVWMDWSQNGGKTWAQCGPFLVTGTGYATRAHEIGPQWKFRACGDTPIAAQGLPRNNCTAFW